MKKCIPTITENPDDLRRLLKAEKDVRKRQRLEALYVLGSGQAKTRQQVAALLGVHRHTVGAWLAAYEQGGRPAMLTIGTAPGRVSAVTPEVKEALRARLAQPQGFGSYGQIQQYLAQEHGVHLAYSTVHSLVRYRLKAKPKTPRPSSKKKDPAQERAFVETFPAQVAALRAEAAQSPRPFKGVRLWAMDETRCGLLPLHRHRITLPGVQPVASVTYRFDFLYLYGAVEPTTGESFLLELPALNAACFQVFLDQWAATDPDHLLGMLVDNGRLHKAASLRIPENIRLVFLPPYTPEWNPPERLWRAIKDEVAEAAPETLEELSSQLTRILHELSPQDIQALTSYSYFVKAVNG